jgi:hypothetical protein
MNYLRIGMVIINLSIIIYVLFTRGLLAAFGVFFLLMIISIVYSIYSFVLTGGKILKNLEESSKIKKVNKEEKEEGIKETFFSLFKKI